MENVNDIFSENCLLRYSRMLMDHDAGAIGFSRRANTRAGNKTKKAKLLAYLVDKGYSVTVVTGSYAQNFGTDNSMEVREETILVVDSKDDDTLKDDLLKLGALYGQDTIIWIPKGEDAMLIGDSEWGKVSYMFFSRIRGRPFALAEGVSLSLYDCAYPGTINGIRGMKIGASDIAKQITVRFAGSKSCPDRQ